MTSVANLSGVYQPLVGVTLTGTSQTIVYTAPNKTTVVKSVTICNPTASPVTAKLFWKKGSVSRMLFVGSIAATSTQLVTEPAFPLGEGETIEAIGANSVEVTVSTIMNVPNR